MPLADVSYRYAGASSLEDARDAGTARHLALVGTLEDVPTPGPSLRSVALAPEITAKGLRAVSEIVGARFYVPPSMLTRILREADPVATVGPGAVRFEGFSACCSAYARLDLLDDALEVSERRTGTTNVDFGPELRAALAQVRSSSRLEITIGPEAVGIAHERAEVVERKVPLPMRWLRGFGEVQVAMAGMERAFQLNRVAALRFLRALPRSKADHLQWVSARGGQAQMSRRETPGAVPLRGGHRLRVLEPLAHAAAALTAYRHPTLGSSGWVLELGAQRLCLTLNLEPWRGFSGDGGALSDLARGPDATDATLRAQLSWQDRLDGASLGATTGLGRETIDRGLGRLGARGLVGYDLAESCYFHRVLPFELDKVLALNPRLKSARDLVAAGAVEVAPDGRTATVKGADVIHRVELAGDAMRCTCPWFARNGTARGACKHALAVEIVLEATKLRERP